MLRKIIGALAGIVAAMLIFMVFEKINSGRFPLPPGVDPADHEAMTVYAQSQPSSALITVLVGWAIGSFICGLLIRIISKSADKIPAYIAGLFLTTAAIVDLLLLPHPIWFIIAGILVFIPMTLLGHAVYKR
ncbi:MAG TPA: hypothetical protein VL093_03325 [Flavipsychrobacter sp.]|nr:hypothetical protein [Flavipsychrobacter sp.]